MEPMKTLTIAGQQFEITDAQAREEIQKMTDVIYPVGSVYSTTSNADPATLFGGTWEPLQSDTAVNMWERTE